MTEPADEGALSDINAKESKAITNFMMNKAWQSPFIHLFTVSLNKIPFIFIL